MEKFGVSYTPAGIRRLLGAHLTLDKRIVVQGDNIPIAEQSWTKKLTTFLNMLPVSTEPVTWGRQFQEAFEVLFPHLASIVVVLNRSASIDGEARPNVQIKVLDYSYGEAGREERERRAVTVDHDTVLASILREMPAMGKDPAKFHPPVDFVGQLSEDNWVGRILLFFPLTSSDPRFEVEAASRDSPSIPHFLSQRWRCS